MESRTGLVRRDADAGRRAVAGRARLPHLTAHDILEIDRDIRAALAQMGSDSKNGANCLDA